MNANGGEQQAVATGKPKVDLETKIYRMLGQYDGFYTHPPLNGRGMVIDGKIVRLNNDGFEVWIGTADEWHTFMPNERFRSVCFWFLRTWIFIDWFGLRSFLWYKFLTRQCNRHKLSARASAGDTWNDYEGKP